MIAVYKLYFESDVLKNAKLRS